MKENHVLVDIRAGHVTNVVFEFEIWKLKGHGPKRRNYIREMDVELARQYEQLWKEGGDADQKLVGTWVDNLFPFRVWTKAELMSDVFRYVTKVGSTPMVKDPTVGVWFKPNIKK